MRRPGTRLGLASARFSRDGTRVVTAGWDKTARVFGMDGTQLAVLRGHDGQVNDASFSPDGTQVVTASGDGTARIWSPEGRVLSVLRGHTKSVWVASFSPDGTRVLTGAADSTARLWDVEGMELAVLRAGASRVVTASFASDGAHLLTLFREDGDDNDVLRVWDRKGGLVTELRSPDGEFQSAEFDPDGTRILTSANDRTARVWDLRGRSLAVFRGPRENVRGPALATYSPDGKLVVTTPAPRVWITDDEALLRVARERAGRELTPEERERFTELLRPVRAPR